MSLGVTVPSVRETQYSFVNGAVQQKATTHTDVYGFFDLYPLAYRWRKDSWAPAVRRKNGCSSIRSEGSGKGEFILGGA